MVLAVNASGSTIQPYACATVGMLQTVPNSGTYHRASVFFTVDLRHPDATTLKRMGAED
jgi:N-carbamoyl-L-amino-acid hydrolase